MFGYIKPNIPELRVREKARYDAWYCGLCRRLGARYGTAARALLSFDCPFLALLAASVSGEDSPEDLLRCPFKPFGKKRAMLGSPSAALDFAADVCVILSEFKLSDDIADGKPLRIAAKLPLLCAFKKARLRRPEVYAAVKKRMRELASVEAPYRGSRAFPRRIHTAFSRLFRACNGLHVAAFRNALSERCSRNYRCNCNELQVGRKNRCNFYSLCDCICRLYIHVYARVECVLKTGCGTDCRVNFTIFRVFL